MPRKSKYTVEVASGIDSSTDLSKLIQSWIAEEMPSVLVESHWSTEMYLRQAEKKSRISVIVCSHTSLLNRVKMSFVDVNGRQIHRRFDMTRGSIQMWQRKVILDKIKELQSPQAEKDLWDSIQEEKREKARKIRAERDQYRDGLNLQLESGSVASSLSYDTDTLAIQVNGNRELIQEILLKIYGAEELALLSVG